MIRKIQNNRTLKSVITVFKTIISLIIILFVSVIFFQRVSNNKFTLGGYSIFTIISESMVPEYEIGDMVIAKKTDPKMIKREDDVVYIGKEKNFKDKIVTHRVIDIETRGDEIYFKTKGLANTTGDPEIKSDQIYGVVVYKSEVLSFFSRILNNSFGFYFLLFVPLAILLFFEIVDITNNKRKVK